MPNSPCTSWFLQQMRLLSLPQSSPLHQIHFPSHPIPSYPIPISAPWVSPRAGAFAQAAPFLPVLISPLPRSWQASLLPGPLASPAGPSLPSPALLRCPLPAPSLLGASFPFLLLATPACPLHSPAPRLRQGPAGGQGQQPLHQPLSTIKVVWDEPVRSTLGWDDTLCLAQTAGFSVQSITVGPGGTEVAPAAVSTLVVKLN